MDENQKAIIRRQMQKTGEALTRNRMHVYYADSKSEALEQVKSLLHAGEIVASGGSMTLEECGVMDLLRSGAYQFLDRAACKLEEMQTLYRKCFSADAYLCSANAVTANGELYNVDGNSNRVAAISYGPSRVIMVVGCNKLVPDLDAAIKRVKTCAAPANAERLSCPTYCKESGSCVSLNQSAPGMTDGCHGDGRICCNYLVSAQQRNPNRMHVILVAEPLGY